MQDLEEIICKVNNLKMFEKSLKRTTGLISEYLG